MNKYAEQKRFEQYYNQIIKKDNLTYAGSILKRASKKWPNRTAFICDDQSITYSQLYIAASNFTKQLKDFGLKSNDKVILLYENSIDFFIAYFGIWQAGAVIAPLNVFLNANEIEALINNAQPKHIVVSDTLQKNLGSYNNQDKIKIFNTQDIENSKKSENVPENFKVDELGFNEMAALLYTSGTTGFPKGVMLSSKNIIINAMQGMSKFKEEINDDDKVYCALPLFHSLPQNMCVWATTLAGATAIIVPKITRKSLLKGLEHKPTMIVAVPSLYGLFCMFKNADFSNVKYFVSGGDALSDKVRSYFGLLYKRKICNGYGLTETSPFISVDMNDYLKPTSNVGSPLPHIEVKIVDEKNKQLNQGQVGILWVKGPNIMLGYYNNPEATAQVIKDGWFYTGDLAYISSEGDIVIAGRHKDIIIHKGINIYPQEIENVLLTHNQVFQAAVIGIANDPTENKDVEIPVAFIATKEPNKEKLEKELLDICKNQLASYKVPKQFIIQNSLPLTSTGKVDKKKLKKEYSQKNKADK